MPKIRCKACVGSGKVMGGGMMMTDCDECDGVGKIHVEEPIKLNKEDVRYKEAIKEIKALDKNISQEEAEAIFDKEFDKIDKKDINKEEKKKSTDKLANK